MSKLRLTSLDVRCETFEPPWHERKYAVDSGWRFRTAYKAALVQNLVHYICTIQVPEIPALTSVVETISSSHHCQFIQAIYRYGKVGWPSLALFVCDVCALAILVDAMQTAPSGD